MKLAEKNERNNCGNHASWIRLIIMKISKDSSIVVLTGAGISKESGLATFRGQGGLWEGLRVEEVASPHAFTTNPAMVHSFYNARKEALLKPEIKPNAAHLALQELDEKWPGEFTLITQNVDNLHEQAGSKNTIHMHGELLKGICTVCETITPWDSEMSVQSSCPACGKTGTMRVDVVWFGEMPKYMKEIYRALERCDLFVSIGTSGNVYPAAGFVQLVSENPNAMTVELNLEPSLNAHQFNDGFYGSATKTVPEFVDQLLSRI